MNDATSFDRLKENGLHSCWPHRVNHRFSVYNVSALHSYQFEWPGRMEFGPLSRLRNAAT